MQLRLTDEQIIERVRRGQRHQRKIGAACVVLGVAGCLLMLWLINNLYRKSTAVVEEISRVPAPSSQQVARSLDETRYVIGFSTGFACAAGLAAMSSLAFNGCVLLLGENRKDALLLKYWDAGAEAR